MHESSTIYKQKPSKTVLNKYAGGCVRTTGDGLFFTGGSIIMDYKLAFWIQYIIMDLFLTNILL